MRNKKISADISIEANMLLNDLVINHERSKGWLLDKMIKKFCGTSDVTDIKKPTEIAAVKKPVKRFVPPEAMEVWGYMIEKGCKSDTQCTEAHKFCDHFESNGWKVGGKTKMVSWKAAVRKWLKGNGNGQNNANTKSSGQKKSAVERVNERNSLKYGQSDECGLGVGSDGRHMGGAVDKGERGATIEYVDNEPFVDY